VAIHWETSLNINLNINNEKQDCKIGIVWGSTNGSGEGKWRRLRWWYMVYEIEQRNLLLKVGQEEGWGGETIVVV
jgi:hypothetical protein